MGNTLRHRDFWNEGYTCAIEPLEINNSSHKLLCRPQNLSMNHIPIMLVKALIQAHHMSMDSSRHDLRNGPGRYTSSHVNRGERLQSVGGPDRKMMGLV
ncbi:unnamed protein product [Prunus brigantina]